jgi:predicted dehydrogenase
VTDPGVTDPGATPVRIGLAGYGRGGRYFHAPLIGLAPECVLTAVVTRNPQRRAELARDFPGVPAVSSLGELAAAGADAVVITTPLDTHEALVREAIALGLPVACDKPFTPDAASARALVAAAGQAGVPLTVYQNRRWDADFRTVRALVESGALGAVTGFESRMEQYPPDGGFATTGGGVLRDFGSHLTDQALQLFGPAAAVYAETHLTPGPGGFDDSFSLSLRHAGGVVSHLRGDWALHGAPGPRFRVTGSTGTFAVEPDDGQAERLLAGQDPGDDAFGTVPQARWGRIYRGENVSPEPVPAEKGRWSSFYSAFARAIRHQGPLPVDPRDAVAALEVLDAARVSAARGEVVRLST